MAETVSGPVPDRRQKVLALLLFITAVMSVYVLAVEPVWTRYRQLDDALAAANARERRYLELLSKRGEIEARVAALDAGDSDAAVLFTGATASIAAARLEGRVRSVVEALGGEIRSSRTRQAAAELDLTRLEVTISARIPFGKLTEMLRRIELGTPYVFLESVSIRSQQNPRGGNTTDRIDLQLTAQGYADVGSAG